MLKFRGINSYGLFVAARNLDYFGQQRRGVFALMFYKEWWGLRNQKIVSSCDTPF